MDRCACTTCPVGSSENPSFSGPAANSFPLIIQPSHPPVPTLPFPCAATQLANKTPGLPSAWVYFPGLLMVEQQLFLLSHGPARGFALSSCLTRQWSERRGWLGRCSARQAGPWQGLCPAFAPSPQGRSLSLTPGFSPATQKGREEAAEGSLRSASTQLPGLLQANHEEKPLCPYSHLPCCLKPPPCRGDHGGALHFQTPPGSGLRSWGLSSAHR